MTSRILAALAAGGLLVSCGGSTSQEVLDGTSSSSGSTSSGTSGGASGTTSGASADAGGNDAGGGADAGAACAPEIEPNNGKDSANTLASSVCGAIAPDSDVDFLTFKLKPTTKNVSLRFDGQVTLKVDVEGQQSVILGGPNAGGKIPFVMDAPYFVEIRPTVKAAAVSWRVDLIER
jgi:hypothetical protein